MRGALRRTTPPSRTIAPARHAGVLLGNHGPIVAGASLTAAVGAIEELEEAAKLAWMLRDLPVRHLTEAQVADLTATFGGR